MMTTDRVSRRAASAWPLMVALLLLPIDWFSPTGLLLREAGAKPASPFLACILLWFLATRAEPVAANLVIRRTLRSFALVGCAGGFAFGVNLLLGWSAFDWSRNPIAQFAGQAAMFGLFVVVFMGWLVLLRRPASRELAMRALPWVAAVHLLCFGLEAGGVLTGNNPFLLLFRGESGTIDRASGLMSEPSYFGAFAALFGMPLIVTGSRWRILHGLLGISLMVCAYLVQAKTMFIVLAAQFVYLTTVTHRHRWTKPLILAIAGLAGVALSFMIQSSAAADLDANLSSVMRVGSTILSANVARAGYALSGVGFGQFNFFYLERFAPDFIFLSQEALDQFGHINVQRASTFNLPLRLLVETGVAGFLIFFGSIASVLWRLRKATEPATRVGLLFVYGSLGFLTTQDTYCFPPLAFGLALALTGIASQALRPESVGNDVPTSIVGP